LCIEYNSPSDKFWNKYDVTFDGLDEELTDFFVMVWRVWENQGLQDSLMKAWEIIE
jgi:hypothetical protein